MVAIQFINLVFSLNLVSAPIQTTLNKHSIEVSVDCPSGVYKEWAIEKWGSHYDMSYALKELLDIYAWDPLKIKRFFWGKFPNSNRRFVAAEYCARDQNPNAVAPSYSFPLTIKFSEKTCEIEKGILFDASIRRATIDPHAMHKTTTDLMKYTYDFYQYFQEENPIKTLKKIVFLKPEKDSHAKIYIEAWYCD